jgi:hypothetical protein
MFNLYSDMDGVLFNFMGRVQEHYPDSYDWMPDNILWPRVESIPNFWAGLDLMPDGQMLWNYMKPHNPTILSAPSRCPSCIPGKNKSIDEKLGEHVPRIFTKAANKKDYAAPNHILVDDSKRNIDDWIKAGGIGILHVSAVESIVMLEGYLRGGR